MPCRDNSSDAPARWGSLGRRRPDASLGGGACSLPKLGLPALRSGAPLAGPLATAPWPRLPAWPFSAAFVNANRPKLWPRRPFFRLADISNSARRAWQGGAAVLPAWPSEARWRNRGRRPINTAARPGRVSLVLAACCRELHPHALRARYSPQPAGHAAAASHQGVVSPRRKGSSCHVQSLARPRPGSWCIAYMYSSNWFRGRAIAKPTTSAPPGLSVGWSSPLARGILARDPLQRALATSAVPVRMQGAAALAAVLARCRWRSW
jgi:hypothetical protein